MATEKIKTSAAELWIEDGIYYIIHKEGKKGTLETAKEELSAHRELSGGKKMPLFADVRRMKGANAEARDFGNSEEVQSTYSAVGILIGSKFTQIIANAFMKVNKPPYPVKMFTTKKEAVLWLRGLKMNEVQDIAISDTRIAKVLDYLLQIASGDYQARLEPSTRGDDIDAIIFGLTTLHEELELVNTKNIKQNWLLENSKKELEKLTEKLTRNIEELKNAQSQLVQSEKMASLGQLTAGIAHEINNPINFVYAGSHALNKTFKNLKKILEKYEVLRPGDPEIISKLKEIESLKKEYAFQDTYEAIPQLIDDIQIGATRTVEIVDGLKNFSRSDEAEFKTVNIHVGIESTLLLLHGKYKDKVIIHKHYDPKAGLIDCYPGQLNQVFMNLLNNAIDAIGNKGEISITTEKLKDKIKISIKDNGMGIKPEIQEKIFEPFFTTKEVGAGTGLGLSICFGIIKRHKGKIEVESQFGQGSEFIITLPQNKVL